MTDPHPTAPPRFRPGLAVRVSERSPTHHVRTPGYVRGKAGTVVGVHGPFPDPEQLAYGLQGAPRWLYAVQFPLTQLWGDDPAGGLDAVRVDLYEHWLEDARKPV